MIQIKQEFEEIAQKIADDMDEEPSGIGIPREGGEYVFDNRFVANFLLLQRVREILMEKEE